LNNGVARHLKKVKDVLCTCKKCTKQQSLLHLACNFRPPLYVVRNLFEFDSFNASRIDSRRRYPLHLALEHKSAVDVVEFLIKSNKVAVGAQDVNGKTPLHMVIEQCAERRERNKNQDLGEITSFAELLDMLELILLLCDAVPSAPFVEDNNGINALEYAIDIEADRELVNALQEKMQKSHTFQMKENLSPSTPSLGTVSSAA